MKKTYITPSMENIKIKTTGMLAASDVSTVVSSDGESGQGQLIDEGASGAGLGRGFAGYDDDDE